MKAGFSTVTLAVALILSGCGEGGGNLNEAAASTNAPLPQIPAPNNGDWTQVVSQTQDGGYRIGNPDAPVKLVEYASLTCPHCARFSEEATASLRDTYVRSGQVSYEFRNFLLGAPDVALSVLARCQPPAAFFGTIEQIFRQQQEFIGAIDETESQRITALPPEQQIAPLARAMDLDTFFARRGMPEPRFNECLGNPRAVQQLTDMTSRANSELQVDSTPTFILNGEKLEVHDWAGVEPRLRASIGG